VSTRVGKFDSPASTSFPLIFQGFYRFPGPLGTISGTTEPIDDPETAVQDTCDSVSVAPAETRHPFAIVPEDHLFRGAADLGYPARVLAC
jgi:hypothetical protein